MKKVVFDDTEQAETSLKSGLSARKVLLGVWWDRQGRPNSQLEPVLVVLSNRSAIVFHRDNARPLISLLTRHKLLELALKILMQIDRISPETITICFCLWRMILLVKNWAQAEHLKMVCPSFLSYEQGYLWK